MSAPLDGRRRSARAGAFVLIAAQIAVVGHVVAGGAPPDLPLLAVMSGLLVVALRPVATRPRSFGVLLAAMAGTQLAFHLVLTLADAHHTSPGHDDSARMLAFHALAALASAALLATGDRLLCALHSWFRRLRPRASTADPVTPSAGWTAVVDRAGRILRSRLAGSTVSRRGPPAELAPSC